MRYGNRSNTRMRMIGYLDAMSGAVFCEDVKSVTVDRLIQSLSKLPERYPGAERIYLVWDNWFNHTNPRTQAALARLPSVRVLPLPTYAPWLNPIEKVWRWARQRVVHAHPWSDDFHEFRRQVNAEFERLAEGSEDLRRYVGLSS